MIVGLPFLTRFLKKYWIQNGVEKRSKLAQNGTTYLCRIYTQNIKHHYRPFLASKAKILQMRKVTFRKFLAALSDKLIPRLGIARQPFVILLKVVFWLANPYIDYIIDASGMVFFVLLMHCKIQFSSHNCLVAFRAVGIKLHCHATLCFQACSFS